MELVERGWDDARIGTALGCTPDAAKLARRRYHIAPKSRVCLTARQAAARLGLSCAKKVVGWIAAGWLRAHRGWGVGQNRAWVVAESSLLRFLADPAHQHRYSVERIVDPGWRAWAERHRGDERYLSQTEAVAWLCRERSICVERATVGQWLNKGLLPFQRDGRGNRQLALSGLTTFERPAFGQGSLKRDWEPCAVCRNGTRQQDGWGLANESAGVVHGDAGGPSRYWLVADDDAPEPAWLYCPKPSRAERNAGLEGMKERNVHPPSGDDRVWDIPGTRATPRANHHPTVKPLTVCRWLVRLVTPPAGLVVDPFVGSGSTGIACALEARDFIGIDREPEYLEIARRRIEHWRGPLFGPVEVEEAG